ncbi:MAG: carbohydate-binding domain-containing protein [Bacteroidales bacterium]|nr:carbohydate-binding domain-containing protein [Bacteroidales bacterium]
MKTINALSILVTLMVLVACTNSKTGEELPSQEALHVSWELVSDFKQQQEISKQVFTIENQGEVTLGPDNWVMYYSQMPRRVSQDDSAPARVEHISGDWFKLTPKEDFSLKPGETIEIPYQCGGMLLKESDAPLNPYFVFLDEDGKESGIVDVQNYTLKPLTWLKNYEASVELPYPVPTAQNRYKNNKGQTEIPGNETMPIVPSPFKVQSTGEKITLQGDMPIFYGKGLENEAEYLAARINEMYGIRLETTTQKPSGESYISLQTDESLRVNGKQKEAYRLTTGQINKITGSDKAGVFYGIQSLLSLIPLESYEGNASAPEIEVMTIEDAPRFHYRGLHLDVARNFQTKEEIYKILDLMASYKLNTLQLYLTDDEGWRLEIEALPELTEIGSKRGHTLEESEHLHPSYGSGPYVDNKHGTGYYTRQDFIDILTYAQNRHIKVIPTVNFPAHARAAIKAMEARYARLMDEGREKEAEKYRLIDPNDTSQYVSAQRYDDNVVCVARQSVYDFYETVVDEIIEIYDVAGVPFDFIHTGGDEVPEGAWAGSPLCRELLDSLPDINDPRNLQTYFFDKAVNMLGKKQLKKGGWEEVALKKGTQGDFQINSDYTDKDVVPYVWNSLGDALNLGYRMANRGYPVVLCNVQNLYFDLAYNPAPYEPGLYWGGFVNTRDAWEFAPYDLFKTIDQSDERFQNMERLKPDARKNIIGLQGQLWSETIKGGEMLEYRALPKLLGLAQRSWSEDQWEKPDNAKKREESMENSWNRFASTLAKQELPRLNYKFGGYNYRIPMPGAVIENGQLKANIEFPGLTIRYTMDGSEPDANSKVYNGPVDVDKSVTVKLKAFDKAGNSGRTVVLD